MQTRRLLAFATLCLALAAPALADGAGLKPAGWSADHSSYTGNWTFTSPDGLSEAQAGFYEIDPKGVAEMLGGHMKPYGTDEVTKSGPSFTGDGYWVTGGGYVDEDDGTPFMAMSVVVPHKLGGALGCYIHGPMVNGGPPAILESFLQGCVAAAKDGDPYDAAQAKRAVQRSAVASKPVKTGKGRAVEALLLDIYYITGAGGGIYPDYQPIVLYADGIACRCLDGALADADPSVVIKSRPDDVTRWTRSGGKYVMTWPGDSEATEIEAGMERPLVYAAGQTLDGYWSRMGGGGNTAMGGDIMVATSNAFRFFRNGTFSTSRSAGASAPGVVTGSSGGEAGRYTIGAQGLLTLTYDSGETTRTSLYHSTGDDPVLWIGGDSFVFDD